MGNLASFSAILMLDPSKRRPISHPYASPVTRISNTVNHTIQEIQRDFTQTTPASASYPATNQYAPPSDFPGHGDVGVRFGAAGHVNAMMQPSRVGFPQLENTILVTPQVLPTPIVPVSHGGPHMYQQPAIPQQQIIIPERQVIIPQQELVIPQQQLVIPGAHPYIEDNYLLTQPTIPRRGTFTDSALLPLLEPPIEVAYFLPNNRDINQKNGYVRPVAYQRARRGFASNISTYYPVLGVTSNPVSLRGESIVQNPISNPTSRFAARVSFATQPASMFPSGVCSPSYALPYQQGMPIYPSMKADLARLRTACNMNRDNLRDVLPVLVAKAPAETEALTYHFKATYGIDLCRCVSAMVSQEKASVQYALIGLSLGPARFDLFLLDKVISTISFS